MTRAQRWLLYHAFGGGWKWCRDFGGPVEAHHDDAHNAFLAALLGWARKYFSHIAFSADHFSTFDPIPDGGALRQYRGSELAALVSAYCQVKGIK